MSSDSHPPQAKDYTSTAAGFERYMRDSLSGSPSDIEAWVRRSTTDDFVMIFNEKEFNHSQYVDFLKGTAQGTSDYEPVVEEFVRDGDRLAAKIGGQQKYGEYELRIQVWMFCTIANDGRVQRLQEVALAGPVGGKLALPPDTSA